MVEDKGKIVEKIKNLKHLQTITYNEDGRTKIITKYEGRNKED